MSDTVTTVNRLCVNPKCGQPMPDVLPIVPLYAGSAGRGFLLTCCGAVCTREFLRDVAGMDLPDPDEPRTTLPATGT